MTVTRPRLIGMVGGMSWESSAEYYRQANELVAAKLGGLHSARLILVSVDFAEVEQLQVTGHWDEAGQLFADIAKRLEAAGAELLVLCTNTMHKVADQIQAAVSIPLGIIRESSRETYRAVINGLVEAGADGVILGCTEIELLIGPSDSPVPVFPTTRLHVEAAVTAALEGIDLPAAEASDGARAPTLAG